MFQIWFGSWYGDWFGADEAGGNELSASIAGSGALTASISFVDNSTTKPTGRRRNVRTLEYEEELLLIEVF